MENGGIHEYNYFADKYEIVMQTETLEEAKNLCVFREPTPYFFKKVSVIEEVQDE